MDLINNIYLLCCLLSRAAMTFTNLGCIERNNSCGTPRIKPLVRSVFNLISVAVLRKEYIENNLLLVCLRDLKEHYMGTQLQQNCELE